MLFQGDHAAAPAHHEQFVERLEQLLVGHLGIGRAFKGPQSLLEHVNQNFQRRHQHHRAKGRARR